MNQADEQHRISTVEALESLYGAPKEVSIAKEVDCIHPLYAQLIQASPFVALATAGADGLDVSPRGDGTGFVVVEDEKTLLLPDRRGNNRVDSLRNIIVDPRVALLFLIPGVSETFRVNGRAHISIDPDLLARFTVDGHLPKSILVVHVEAAYFQCSRAIVRSKLWDHTKHVTRASLPSAGTILAALTHDKIDGQQYDRDLPGRVATTLY
jgi:PPOX class probable FMN-dependent enzyme